MKDLAISRTELIFLILAFLGKSGLIICSCICLALAVINLKIKRRELLGSTDLSGAQILCIYKMTKVIMVYKDENFMFAAF